MTLTTRINILNLNPGDTSAMDLWKTIAGFTGFSFDRSPIVGEANGEDDYTEVCSPLDVRAKTWVSVTYRGKEEEEGCNPITVLLNTRCGAECKDIHNEVVTKLVEHLFKIKPSAIVLAQNGYTNQWVANAAPY